MRRNNYAAHSDVDSIEALTAKLTADLREHVRFMADYPVLSDEWSAMAEQISRIGDITEMERSLPKKADATLWECEEIALRYLLEDGKINLCLRNLVDYNDFFKNLVKRGPIKDTTLTLLEKFERGMCLTLKNAWLHAEAVQITDLPLLMQYISNVMSYCIDHPEYLGSRNIKNGQEMLTIYFLLGLSKQLDTIDESRVMPIMEENRLFAQLAMHLQNNAKLFQKEDMLAGLETLALICKTEDYQSHWDHYVDSIEARRALLGLKDALDEATQEYEMRKRLRPLIDTVNRVQRSMRK